MKQNFPATPQTLILLDSFHLCFTFGIKAGFLLSAFVIQGVSQQLKTNLQSNSQLTCKQFSFQIPSTPGNAPLPSKENQDCLDQQFCR